MVHHIHYSNYLWRLAARPRAGYRDGLHLVQSIRRSRAQTKVEDVFKTAAARRKERGVGRRREENAPGKVKQVLCAQGCRALGLRAAHRRSMRSTLRLSREAWPFAGGPSVHSAEQSAAPGGAAEG